ncbi:MAG: aldose 1-epimerase family protein [Oscillospiraceae bacterium]
MIYTIKDNSSVAKIDSVGATLISFIGKSGEEVIWQRDENFWGGSAPILFPVVGKTKDGIITVDGVDYPMPKHGIVRKEEFEMIESSENQITFKYTSSEKTLAMYPWEFELFATFKIENGELTNTLKVRNIDTEEMYFCIGAHPAFNVPRDASETFEDWQIEFEVAEPLYSIRMCEDDFIHNFHEPIVESGNVLPLKRSLFNDDAVMFERLESRSVKLVSSKTGKGVNFSFYGFPTLALWTREAPFKANFLCLEPWRGMAPRIGEGTDLKKKFDVQSVSPYADFTVGYTIGIID